jgi:hypothetical protein
MKASSVLALMAGLTLFWGSACSERTLTPREGRVVFSVGESYRSTPGPPTIQLRLETEKIYPCCNYILVTRLSHSGSEFIADIQGIDESVVCFTSLGPAGFSEFIELGNGRYALQFRDGHEWSAYWLTVDEGALTIQGQAESGSGLAIPASTVFWRYPQNSFAVICGTTVETAWVFEDFLSRLRAAVELREIEFPAYGELGYPRAPQGHWVNHPGRYFGYGDPQDFAAAGEVLRTYVRDVIGPLQGVGIELRNWLNESYMSWLMD